LVGCGELDPAKCAGGVFFDGSHSAESLLPGVGGSKGGRCGSGKLEIGNSKFRKEGGSRSKL
jgi:hypothetical protein